MIFPKTMKIGGHTYKILIPYEFKERTDLWGQHDGGVHEIRISDLDSSGVKRSASGITVSFIHEILHAVDYVTGHGVFFKNENAIEGFSESIYQILKDNGWLE